MKIVFIHTDFRIYWPPRLKELYQYLKIRSIEMHVVEIAGSGSPYSFEGDNRSHPDWWHCLFPDRKMEDITSGLAGKALSGMLDKINPDILFSGAIAFPSGATAVKWGTKNNKKVVIFDDAKLENIPRSSLVDWIKRKIYSGVDAVFCPSPAWNNTFRYFGFHYDQLFYGLNVVDNAFWSDRNENMDLQFTLPDNFIISVGRQIHQKNFIFLLKGFSNYSKQVINPKTLVLVGNGLERKALEQFIRESNLENVYLLDFQNQNSLRSILKRADIFILPSKSETWGLVVNEAMATGLPVLVSNQVGCASTLVQEGVNGYTFSPDNLSELTELLIRMHKMTDEEINEMGQASSRIIGDWGHERFCEGVLDAINYLSDKPKRMTGIKSQIIIHLWKGRYRPV